MAKFLNIFSVESSHSYYTSNKDNSLSWLPTSKTQEKIKNLGAIFRPNGPDFAVAAKVTKKDNGDFELAKSIVDESKFIFSLKSSNQWFMNSIDIDFDLVKKNTIQYFSNEKNISSSTDIDLISSGLSLSTTLDLKPKVFGFEEETDPGAYTLKDSSDTTIVLKGRDKIYYQNGFVQVDISSLEDGKYTLSYGNKIHILYCSNELSQQKPFGVLEIFQDTNYAGSTLLMNKVLPSSVKNFQLPFESRSILWRYVIVDSGSGSTISNVSLEDVTMVNGGAAASYFFKPLNLNLNTYGGDFAPIMFTHEQSNNSNIDKEQVLLENHIPNIQLNYTLGTVVSAKNNIASPNPNRISKHLYTPSGGLEAETYFADVIIYI